MRRYVIAAVAAVGALLAWNRARKRHAEDEMWAQITDEAPVHRDEQLNAELKTDR